MNAEQVILKTEQAFLDLSTSSEITLARVVLIDNWFGPRWLNFGGKVLGQLGVWDRRAIPPFVPSRVLLETSWSRAGAGWERSEDRDPLHIEIDSERGTRRKLDQVAPGESFCWIGAEDGDASRIAIMTYIPGSDGESRFYAHVANDGGWKLRRTQGITVPMWHELMGACLETIEAVERD